MKKIFKTIILLFIFLINDLSVYATNDNLEKDEDDNEYVYKHKDNNKNIKPFIFKEGSLRKEYIWYEIQKRPFFLIRKIF